MTLVFEFKIIKGIIYSFIRLYYININYYYYTVVVLFSTVQQVNIQF